MWNNSLEGLVVVCVLLLLMKTTIELYVQELAVHESLSEIVFSFYTWVYTDCLPFFTRLVILNCWSGGLRSIPFVAVSTGIHWEACSGIKILWCYTFSQARSQEFYARGGRGVIVEQLVPLQIFNALKSVLLSYMVVQYITKFSEHNGIQQLGSQPSLLEPLVSLSHFFLPNFIFYTLTRIDNNDVAFFASIFFFLSN